MAKKMVELVAENGAKLKPVSEKKAQKYIDHGLAYRSTGDRVFMRASLQEANALIKSEPTEEATPCWGCSERVPNEEGDGKRPWCEPCKDAHVEKQVNKSQQYMVLRTELMLERAIKILENQEFEIKIAEYKEAIEVLREAIGQKPDKFDSAQEMVAAIELIKNHIMVKVHCAVDKYIPDFLLPEEKIVLEIDGHFHQHSRVADKEKDIKIRTALGAEWEVIRIPTEYLEMNIGRLTDAIFEMKDYMQNERQRNGGILPESFSKRDKAFWKSSRKK